MSQDQPSPLPPGLDVAQNIRRIVGISLARLYAEQRGAITAQGLRPEFLFKQPVEFRSHPECGHLVVLGEFLFLGLPEGAEGEEPEEGQDNWTVKIEARFELTYEIEEMGSFSENSLSEFARLNGKFNAWPYWREVVQSSLSRMGLPVVTVPVLQPLKAPVLTKAKASPMTSNASAQDIGTASPAPVARKKKRLKNT